MTDFSLGLSFVAVLKNQFYQQNDERMSNKLHLIRVGEIMQKLLRIVGVRLYHPSLAIATPY